MLSWLQASVTSPTFGKLLSCKRLAFTPRGLSKEVSIPVLPLILEGPELVYLRMPGELCSGGVIKQKVFLRITGTCLYESHSRKLSMPVEGPIILVQSAVKQVSFTDFPKHFISTVGLDDVFIKPLSRRLIVTGHSNYPCLIMVLSILSVCLRKIFTYSLQPVRSCRLYALLHAFMGMNTLCL